MIPACPQDSLLDVIPPTIASAQAHLRASSYHALRSLVCEYSGGVLTIRGRVPSFYLKQIVQTELARKVRFSSINNLVEVLASTDRAGNDLAAAATVWQRPRTA